MTPHPALVLTEEVREALRDRRPVVALESTIISHGMPYPQNVEMANAVEAIVRSAGAVPATIALLHGTPRIGLGPDDLELLATSRDVTKVSIRDLPYVIAKGLHGATTVAATMRLAALAGIAVFVTGGIGGVHRGAPTSFDISADLTELATTDVCVISAGAKSILDIGLTLEVMETLGVPVVVFGSDDMPAFYSRRSGFPAPMRVDAATEIASMMHAKWDLGLAGGISVANPIPVADEIPASKIDSIIEQALGECDAAGITGKDTTPRGRRGGCVRTALVKHNATLPSAAATTSGARHE